jgi:hypothetical protein
MPRQLINYILDGGLLGREFISANMVYTVHNIDHRPRQIDTDLYIYILSEDAGKTVLTEPRGAKTLLSQRILDPEYGGGTSR